MKVILTRIYWSTKQIIEIRLDDECHNGHDDFSMTADLYEKRKNGRWVCVGGGCCHDDIVAKNKDLKIFADLHLRNNIGQPLYAIENGLYWIKDGNKKNIQEMYLLTDEEAEEIMNYNDKESVLYFIKKHDLEKRWKELADKGIAKLEELCGGKYTPTTTKYQDLTITDDEVKECEEREKSGYYSKEQAAKRKELEMIDIINKKIANDKEVADKEIADIKKSNEVKTNFLNWFAGQKDLLIYTENVISNFIYYHHTNTISLNWKYSQLIPQEVAEEIVKRLSGEVGGETLKQIGAMTIDISHRNY